MRFLYSALLYLMLPVLLLRLWHKGRVSPAYRQRWKERLGFSAGPKASKGRGHIWFHTVSVGETIAAAPIIEAILDANESTPVVVTTMTPTGSDRVKAIFGDRVEHVYCPWDLPLAVNAFWRRFNPSKVIMMETEVWPNIVAKAKRSETPIGLANARMSERSCRGYHKVSALTRPTFAGFDLVMAQSSDDGARLLSLGVRKAALKIVGSVKFDVTATEAQIEKGLSFKDRLGNDRFCWVAASTHPDEDEQMLEAHAKLLESVPDAVLLLVPRHPERFAAVYTLSQLRFSTIWRTQISVCGTIDRDVAVVVGDTMGEMMTFFAAADVAVVGGSFVPHGGHNVLEPAAFGKPVASGLHVFNFQTICDEMFEAQALELLSSASSLGDWLVEMANSSSKREQAGVLALDFIEARRGSLSKQIDGINSLN